MLKKDDKLRNLLWWNKKNASSNAVEEINIWNNISPIHKIKVVWVWWGWQNSVNRMIEWGLEWVEFIAMNTDTQALFNSLSPTKLNIWKVITGWLWAWSDPEVWEKSAEESREEIKTLLEWSNMVFITCWLGWWTWTWAAPVVAEIAKELWALTIWIVTKPFSYEGQNRMKKAMSWYKNLKEKVDALITIPNDRVLSIIDKKTPMREAYTIIDDILNQWVQWVSDLITRPWDVNLDFADIKSVMKNAWSALMWIGYGWWENRAVEAARSAIDSPLLDLSIAWARWLLVNLTWGHDMSMFEIDEAMKIITESVDNDANIIVGQSIHDDYDGEIKITVVATGFDEDSNSTYWDNQTTRVANDIIGRNKIGNSWNIKPVSSTTNWFTKTQQPWSAWFWKKSSDDLDVPPFLSQKV